VISYKDLSLKLRLALDVVALYTNGKWTICEKGLEKTCQSTNWFLFGSCCMFHPREGRRVIGQDIHDNVRSTTQLEHQVAHRNPDVYDNRYELKDVDVIKSISFFSASVGSLPVGRIKPQASRSALLRRQMRG